MDLIREEHLRALEKHLAEACKEARVCGVGLEEMKELLEIIHEEQGE